MSYTEIWKINKEGHLAGVADIKNSWGWAMGIWAVISYKCFNRIFYVHHADEVEELWTVGNNKDIENYIRLALGTTFDGVMIRQKNLPKLIKIYKKFYIESQLYKDIKVPSKYSDTPAVVLTPFSIPDIIKVLENHLLNDKDCDAVCMNISQITGWSEHSHIDSFENKGYLFEDIWEEDLYREEDYIGIGKQYNGVLNAEA